MTHAPATAWCNSGGGHETSAARAWTRDLPLVSDERANATERQLAVGASDARGADLDDDQLGEGERGAR